MSMFWSASSSPSAHELRDVCVMRPRLCWWFLTVVASKPRPCIWNWLPRCISMSHSTKLSVVCIMWPKLCQWPLTALTSETRPCVRNWSPRGIFMRHNTSCRLHVISCACAPWSPRYSQVLHSPTRTLGDSCRGIPLINIITMSLPCIWRESLASTSCFKATTWTSSSDYAAFVYCGVFPYIMSCSSPVPIVMSKRYWLSLFILFDFKYRKKKDKMSDLIYLVIGGLPLYSCQSTVSSISFSNIVCMPSNLI